MPDVSLVICTRNRVESLRRCVEAALATVGHSTFELVIVDNASTDGTAEYLSNLTLTRTRVPIKVVFEPTPGQGRAHNTGWRASSGDIIAFTDDDCYVAPNFIDAVKASFADPNIGFVGGRVLLYDPTDDEMTTVCLERTLYLEPYTFIPAGCVIGANLAFRRTALEQIGGFDERTGAGTPFPVDDVVAAAKAVWNGIRGMYDPAPTVYHHHGRKAGDEVAELSRHYGIGRGAYYAIFMADKKARWTYGKALLRTVISDGRVVAGALRRGHLPVKRPYFTELKGSIALFMAAKSQTRSSANRSRL
jgi:glycosyltransferase involved in cell wall biosynthesis